MSMLMIQFVYEQLYAGIVNSQKRPSQKRSSQKRPSKKKPSQKKGPHKKSPRKKIPRRKLSRKLGPDQQKRVIPADKTAKDRKGSCSGGVEQSAQVLARSSTTVATGTDLICILYMSVSSESQNKSCFRGLNGSWFFDFFQFFENTRTKTVLAADVRVLLSADQQWRRCTV